MEEPPKYFTREENEETLQKGNKLCYFVADEEKADKPKYTYTTGATFTGSWFGGFRHGEGTMVWKDGASYTGNWCFNYASKYGKF